MSLRHLTSSTRNFDDLALIAQGYSNHDVGKEIHRKFTVELADLTNLFPLDGKMEQNEYSLSTSQSFYLECNRQKSADLFIVE